MNCLNCRLSRAPMFIDPDSLLSALSFRDVVYRYTIDPADAALCLASADADMLLIGVTDRKGVPLRYEAFATRRPQGWGGARRVDGETAAREAQTWLRCRGPVRG